LYCYVVMGVDCTMFNLVFLRMFGSCIKSFACWCIVYVKHASSNCCWATSKVHAIEINAMKIDSKSSK
jgi:hypothetical protein